MEGGREPVRLRVHVCVPITLPLANQKHLNQSEPFDLRGTHEREPITLPPAKNFHTLLYDLEGTHRRVPML